MTTPQKPSNARRWKFFRSGDVDQVVLRNGDDIANLEHLDQKLWMALGMPTKGLEFDPKTAALLDVDNDGRIRPPELLAAVRWARDAFHNLDGLLQGGTTVPLSAIKDPVLQATARRILESLDKRDATVVTLADVEARTQAFAGTRFNGDGVITADTAADESTRKAINDIITTLGAAVDRSKEPGVSQATVDAFFTQAAAWLAWNDEAAKDPAIQPLGEEGTAAASAAVQAVRTKVDDYFARCRVAAFDARAVAAMNRDEKDYVAMAGGSLNLSSPEIAALPLAPVAAGRPLPLDASVNPAWAEAIRQFQTTAVLPILGAGTRSVSEADWATLQTRLSRYHAWQAARPVTTVDKLGAARLRELATGNLREALSRLISQDLELEPEYTRLAGVEKLVRFQRDMYELLTNYVNFSDFYGRTWAVFQAGTLYLDARACHLCIEVADPAKHAAMATLSSAFLAYCELTRPGGLKRTIVAVFTDGDSDGLMVGRNGLFYDRRGQDWDATIMKIVSNPISVREAFWLPYKKLMRFIEEQIAKRAQAADEASTLKMAQTATAVTTADAARPAAAAVPKKLDLGTIALIGTAIGGIGSLVGGFLAILLGLGIWLPLGVVGLLMLISGPSMLLAWLKLRLRNLGPILDANGWAINTRARMNVPFGASLTELAELPPGSERSLKDPFATKTHKRLYVLLGVLAALLVLAWWLGTFGPLLPTAA